MIRVIGDDIEFDRKVVATLKAGVAASLMDSFIIAIEEVSMLHKRIETLEEELADAQNNVCECKCRCWQ